MRRTSGASPAPSPPGAPQTRPPPRSPACTSGSQTRLAMSDTEPGAGHGHCQAQEDMVGHAQCKPQTFL